MILEKYSFGVGDRFGCQGKAQGNGTQKSKPSNNRYIEHGILSVVML